MAWITVAVGVAATLGGIALGGVLTRRNERRAQGERLLVEAFNDAVSAIAKVSMGDQAAASGYLSAVTRIGLHSPPTVLEKFRDFQMDPTVETADGQARLIAAIQAARTELGYEQVKDADLAGLLFGKNRPSR